MGEITVLSGSVMIPFQRAPLLPPFFVGLVACLSFVVLAGLVAYLLFVRAREHSELLEECARLRDRLRIHAAGFKAAAEVLREDAEKAQGE